MSRPAVFLDRDGTIIREVNYLADPSQVELLAGAAEAIAQWNAAGVPVIVVTNQAGVARGYFAEERIAEVHRRLDVLLAEHHARIDGYYVCPHHPTAGESPYRCDCTCRKPLPGMLIQAAAEHDLDLPRSAMVGDKISDLQAGAAAGCATILVRTGYGEEVEGQLDHSQLRVLGVADSLIAAATLLTEASISQ